MATKKISLFDALNEVEISYRELELGLHRSIILDVDENASTDDYGVYFSIQFKQLDTDVCTARNFEEQTDIKNVVKVRRGENRINAYGYPVKAGDGWMRFFDQLFEQFPQFKGRNRFNALQEARKHPMNVWYTRTKKGYINAYLTEEAYQYALGRGETGGVDTPADNKELNEDCPF